MAVYDLEEQEQLDELKTWWKLYGNLVTIALAVLALAAVSWQGWNWYQRSQAAQAATVYAGIERAANGRDVKQVRQLAGELIDKYPRTTYAAMGALLSGKVSVESDDAKNAQAHLQWAADNAKDEALRDLARLRLAALLLDEKAYDAALKPLAGETSPAFAARFAELKGDVLASQDGKKAEAKTAYEAAVAALEKQEKEGGAGQHRAYHDVLQAKLDSLGGAK